MVERKSGDDTQPIRESRFERNGLPRAPRVHGCFDCDAYAHAVAKGHRPTAFVSFPDPNGAGKHTHSADRG